jgi:hypothetical protein
MAMPTHPLTALAVADLDSAIDFEIPPIARCLTCHLLDCDGCRRIESRRQVAWQREGGGLSLLWATTKESVQAGKRSCLDVERPQVLDALSFAVFAELATSASVTLLLVLLLQALDVSAGRLDVVLLLWLGLAGFLVLVHALWGLGLELAAWFFGLGFSPKRGLSFAFYACGWDLMTSPVGILTAMATSGAGVGWAEVRTAARVPRAAVMRYLSESRGASNHEATAAMRFSFLLPVGLLVTAMVVLMVAWARAAIALV